VTLLVLRDPPYTDRHPTLKILNVTFSNIE
jgi:hypothetical protein